MRVPPRIDPAWPVRIADMPGMGMCLIAARMIPAGEVFLREPPLLLTDPHTAAFKPESALRAFCAQGADVRAQALEFWSPMDMDSDLHRECLQQATRMATTDWAPGFEIFFYMYSV